MRKSSAAVAAAALAASFGVASAAQAADTTIIRLGATGNLSATHNIVRVHARVTCSPDTTDAHLSGTLTEVTHGNVQKASAAADVYNGVECTGDPEWVTLAIRRPTGGFKWDRGPARLSDVTFSTTDPSGSDQDFAKGRTIKVV
ncbi:MAG: hypothetical protein ACXVXM_10575 [Nocardioidaceae bacterium]